MSLNRRPLITPVRALLFRLAALLCVAGWAASEIRASGGAVPRHVTRHWTVERGLPHNTVNRVVQDQRGYLWVATAAGLARFDGVTFQEFRVPNRPLPTPGNIRDLVRSGPNRLLMLPSSGGIWEYADAGFEPHPMNAALSGESLLDLFVEPGGAVWASTLPLRLMRWEDGRLQSFGAEAGLVRRVNRISFAVDGAGHTWVAAGEFLGIYRDGQLRPVEPALQDQGTAFLIAPARSGGIWVATSDVLLRWDSGRFSTVLSGGDWPARRSGVECLYEDRQGRLWVGSRRHGLYVWEGGRLTATELSERMVSAVMEDRDGNIWAATAADGLVRLRPQTYTLLDSGAGLRETVSSSVCEDATGTLWLANRSGGLARYRDGRVEPITTGTRLDRFAARVAADGQGRIWAGADNGLFWFPAAAPERIQPAEPSLTAVRILYGSARGDLWVASAEGLGYFRDLAYHPVLTDGDDQRARIDALAEDSRGTIWVAATQQEGANAAIRVWAYENGALHERIGPASWPGGQILSLRIDAHDRLWFGTAVGLVLLEDGRLTRVTTAEGLMDDIIYQQLEDTAGRIWLGSRRGFFRVDGDALIGVAGGAAARVLPVVYGADDGLEGAAAVSVGQPREWRGRDGRLWFTSQRGIIGFDPKALPPGGAPPSVYLQTITCDGHARPLGTAPIEIDPDVRRITFRFAVLNFSAPEQIHVRHRLEGYDREWVDAQSERTATYSRLPPGRYRLRVVAANQSGVWNEEGASLTFTVLTPWWQTSWFIGTAVLAVGAVIAWAARTWSVRKLRRQLDELERQHALQQERARIARNLHDELGGSLTQIGLLAERVKRRSPDELQGPLHQLAWRTRSLAGDLESIVWAISPQNNAWDRLASFIARFADRFFRDTAIRCTVIGVESIPALPLGPETQHEILAALKETLNNVLKHSQAAYVTIRVEVVQEHFVLEITDDGVGFDPAAREHSERNGLNNIRTRGATLGGEVVISSRPGAGSTVILRVPLSRGGGGVPVPRCPVAEGSKPSA